MAEYFPSIMKSYIPFLALHKLDMVVHTYHPSTREAEAEGSQVQGHLGYTLSLDPFWATFRSLKVWLGVCGWSLKYDTSETRGWQVQSTVLLGSWWHRVHRV